MKLDLTKTPSTPFERRGLAPGTPVTPAPVIAPDIKPLTSEEVGKASVLAGTNACDKDYNSIKMCNHILL
jgi:hypothetical protein